MLQMRESLFLVLTLLATLIVTGSSGDANG